jgi:hypothetical protein
MHAQFRDNGGIGLVRKPEWMIKGRSLEMLDRQPRKLKMHVYSAHKQQGWNIMCGKVWLGSLASLVTSAPLSCFLPFLDLLLCPPLCRPLLNLHPCPPSFPSLAAPCLQDDLFVRMEVKGMPMDCQKQDSAYKSDTGRIIVDKA